MPSALKLKRDLNKQRTIDMLYSSDALQRKRREFGAATMLGYAVVGTCGSQVLSSTAQSSNAKFNQIQIWLFVARVIK